MHPETINWMLEQSDEKLVEVLLSAGRIPHDEKDYWLWLMPQLRASRPEEVDIDWKARALEAESKLNAPELHNFRDAVVLEAAHQRERWGNEHDAGKTDEDWLWLVAYLSTKAAQANRYGDREKRLHHIITCGAACANWHAFATGEHTGMRAGVDPVKYESVVSPLGLKQEKP